MRLKTWGMITTILFFCGTLGVVAQTEKEKKDSLVKTILNWPICLKRLLKALQKNSISSSKLTFKVPAVL